jgi:hypothetical protein
MIALRGLARGMERGEGGVGEEQWEEQMPRRHFIGSKME